MTIIFSKNLFWKNELEFRDIGSPLLTNQIDLICNCMDAGNYTWKIVTDTADPVTTEVATGTFTVTTGNDSETISLTFSSPTYNTTDTYYLAVKNTTTLQEGIQVSFTLSEVIIT